MENNSIHEVNASMAYGNEESSSQAISPNADQVWSSYCIPICLWMRTVLLCDCCCCDEDELPSSISSDTGKLELEQAENAENVGYRDGLYTVIQAELSIANWTFAHLPAFPWYLMMFFLVYLPVGPHEYGPLISSNYWGVASVWGIVQFSSIPTQNHQQVFSAEVLVFVSILIVGVYFPMLLLFNYLATAIRLVRKKHVIARDLASATQEDNQKLFQRNLNSRKFASCVLGSDDIDEDDQIRLCDWFPVACIIANIATAVILIGMITVFQGWPSLFLMFSVLYFEVPAFYCIYLLISTLRTEQSVNAILVKMD
jgi:hypothetical protein